MRINDLVGMSMRSLWRRKLRTALTVLGVVIGTVSIVLMLSLGIAMDQNIEEQFAQWGDLTLINLYGYSWGGSEAPQITDEVIKEISNLSNVTRVIPRLRTDAYLTFGKERSIYSMQIVALNKEDMEALGYELEVGEFPDSDDKYGVVIGSQALAYMSKIGKKVNWDTIKWGDEAQSPSLEFGKDKIVIEAAYYDDKGRPQLEGSDGKKIKEPKGIEVKVTGQLVSKDWRTSEAVFVSKKTYDELLQNKKAYQKKLGWGSNDSENDKNQEQTYEEVMIKVNDRENVVEVVDAIKALGYSDVQSSMEDIERVKEQSNSKRMALGGIGIVSFLVAAIGIANTMMMSIYERTKEIGVMKVIGAKLIDIKRMFLLEALLIGAIGGVIGSLISLGVSKLMNMMGAPIAEMLGMYGASTVSIVPAWLMITATLFATLVGLLSGYFPAKKATKLSALTAIKTE